VPSAGGAQAATPARFPGDTWPLVPAVPPPSGPQRDRPGSCRATRKYVMTSRHAAEAQEQPDVEQGEPEAYGRAPGTGT